MTKFRKRPMVIDALLWDNSQEARDELHKLSDTITFNDKEVFIGTLEGIMRAGLGDWIIRGVNGEFYPCKSDIFYKSYEMVDGGLPYEFMHQKCATCGEDIGPQGACRCNEYGYIQQKEVLPI